MGAQRSPEAAKRLAENFVGAKRPLQVAKWFAENFLGAKRPLEAVKRLVENFVTRKVASLASFLRQAVPALSVKVACRELYEA